MLQQDTAGAQGPGVVREPCWRGTLPLPTALGAAFGAGDRGLTASQGSGCHSGKGASSLSCSAHPKPSVGWKPQSLPKRHEEAGVTGVSSVQPRHSSQLHTNSDEPKFNMLFSFSETSTSTTGRRAYVTWPGVCRVSPWSLGSPIARPLNRDKPSPSDAMGWDQG